MSKAKKNIDLMLVKEPNHVSDAEFALILLIVLAIDSTLENQPCWSNVDSVDQVWVLMFI